ncbi:MAG: hypothetical protein ACTSVA_01280 [Candidatus Njordarchaeales archaeon]
MTKKCRARLNPREHIQRIIKYMIIRNQDTIKDHLNYLGTYDPAVWESIARGFQKVINFARLSSQILQDESVIDWTQEILLRRFRELKALVELSVNPIHKIRGLAKLARGVLFLAPKEAIDLLSSAAEGLNNIGDLEERIRSASYLLFEIGYMLRKKDSVFSKERIPTTYVAELEKIARKIAERSFQWISYITSPVIRARALAFLSEGMRNLSLVIQQGEYGVKWIDTSEAEAMASLALKEIEATENIFEKALVKVYVGYLFATLSYDLADTAERLFDDALRIALELIRDDARKAGRILGEIAYCKVFLGDEDSAESLFEEGVATSLKCPDWRGVTTSLYITELAARARLYRIAAELLEDHILPIINNQEDRIKAAALKGVAADIAAWIDTGWAARLAQNGAEELWTHPPSVIFEGEQVYLIGLAAAKSAFADPDASWRFMDYLVTLLRDDNWIEDSIEYVSPYWWGRAYSALIDMPKLANYFKRILLETLYVLEDMLNEEEFAKILIEVAHGIGKGNVELARELIEKGIRLALDKPSEPILLGKALKALEEFAISLSDSLLNEIQKRAESKESPTEILDYLTKAIKASRPSKGSLKLAQTSVDILSETPPNKIPIEKIRAFLKVLKTLDPSWASEVSSMIEETRREARKKSENKRASKRDVGRTKTE